MIRQLGIPTWFLSFSAAETRWLHLLKILSRTVQGKELTDEQVSQMNWKTKSHLIQSDPVTCARHFDYMVHKFISTFLKSSCHPIGHITDNFYRVEFQQRGSPHIHMLAWIHNAPVYGKSSNTEVTKFIDKYVTCLKPRSRNHKFNKFANASSC